jgi:hypothetical protein
MRRRRTTSANSTPPPCHPAAPARTRPPGDADERTQLVGWLDLQRAIVHRKCEGLAEADAAAPLDALARNAEYGADALSLRWILCHMLEEVARHVGHLDLRREQLDGAKGYH